MNQDVTVRHQTLEEDLDFLKVCDQITELSEAPV